MYWGSVRLLNILKSVTVILLYHQKNKEISYGYLQFAEKAINACSLKKYKTGTERNFLNLIERNYKQQWQCTSHSMEEQDSPLSLLFVKSVLEVLDSSKRKFKKIEITRIREEET